MLAGGSKVQKIQKTKFKKTTDSDNYTKSKPKHHDRSTYRLLRQEKEYEFTGKIKSRD